MTDQKDFLKRLLDALENAGIAYMLSGSLGSSFHGRPRATNDVDIIIGPSQAQLDTFLKSLGKQYYVSADAVRDAFEHNAMFNVIDIEGSWKADFVIRKNRPFSLEEFDRRRRASVMGIDVWLVSPEDVILSKLEWSKGDVAGNQFRDALGVVVAQWGRLDHDYLNKWAENLQLTGLLEQLLKQAHKLVD